MSPPQAAIDVLLSLLDAEQGALFNFLAQSWPHLTRATVEMRGRLAEISGTSFRHAEALTDMIEALGGEVPPRRVEPEDQYLAFLTLEFLIPKLAQAKELLITRYENALAALGGAPPDAVILLDVHLKEHRGDLEYLQHAVSLSSRA